MSSDALVVLKDDHATIKRLFREFERAQDADERMGLARSVIGELTAHTFVENEIMYPEVRAALPDLEADVMESYEEHHVADVLCRELWELAPDDEHFVAKMTVLKENVLHHIDEEERDWFPKVREGLGRAPLREMGERILAAKAAAPREPTDPRAVATDRTTVTA